MPTPAAMTNVVLCDSVCDGSSVVIKGRIITLLAVSSLIEKRLRNCAGRDGAYSNAQKTLTRPIHVI